MAASDPIIQVWRDASDLETVAVAPDFHGIVKSGRLKEAMRRSFSVGGVTAAAVVQGQLRGYATLVPASALAGERWHDLPDAYELGAIEVARSARGCGLATALAGAMGRCLPVERLVIFARAVAGHWDPGGAGLTLAGYRRMLITLGMKAGLSYQDSDDPMVTDHPASVLLARVGREVPIASLIAFLSRLRQDRAHAWR
jgi:hypothetical protein